MIARLKKYSSAQIWRLSFAGSLAATEGLIGGADMLLKGTVDYGDLLAGFAASLLVAGIVGSVLISWLVRQSAASQSDGALWKEPVNEAAGVAEQAEPEDACSDSVPHEVPEAAPVRKEKGQKHADIKRAIRHLDVLPAMPVIAQRLLALRLDTEEGEQMLLALVEQDAQISAKIIGLANSAMVGATRQIRTVREAAMLLGSRRVQSVATSIAIISLMAKAPVGEFNLRYLWLHGIRVAFAMQGIARAMPAGMRPQDDQILLAGMLHDIGYLVQAYLDPQLSDRLHNRLAAEPERPAIEVEREIVDICHDELGAELADHWSLPEEIAAVLRYHHNPDAPEAAAGQPLVRMINLAEKLQPSLGIVEYVVPEIAAGEWEALGIEPTRMEEVKEMVDEQVAQAMQLVDTFT